MGEHVRFPGFIADEDLPALYTLADLLAFPSLYEGFGLPPLEAMACGTPVVSSNNSSLPEAVGAAALLVNAEDVEALADAMARVLCDANLRVRLADLGRAQAARFTWAEGRAEAAGRVSPDRRLRDATDARKPKSKTRPKPPLVPR